jgi:hypothetical protein
MMIKKFRRGLSLSCDFGSWDSTIAGDIRGLIEETIISSFLADLPGAAECPLTRKAYEDRMRETLRLRSDFFMVSAQAFGRQSGDRGTSVLNYLTNFLMVAHLNYDLTGMSFQQYMDTLDDPKKHESTDMLVDFMAEGDDLVLFFRGFNDEAVLMNRVWAHYDKYGLNLEPQVEGGRVIQKPFTAFRAPEVRVEFVSKVFTTVNDRTYMLPKLSKLFSGVFVTFSKERIEDVGYSAALSGLCNTGRLPLTRALFVSMRDAYRSAGSGTFKAVSWWDKKLMWEAKDRSSPNKIYTPETVATEYIKDTLYDEPMRRAIAREYPALTVSKQKQIEELFAATQGSTLAEWWNAAGAAVSEVLQSLQ